jgi:serine protease Do
VTRDGKILTNNHVIFDAKRKAPYQNIRVYFKPQRVTGDLDVDLKDPYKVKILARDEKIDLAVLQVINPPPHLTVVGMSNSEQVEIGSSVAAIGHPGGGGLWTLTTGTISSTRRDGDRDVFQTDAAINPGNSGGPLLDADAHLIGINTFVRRVNAQGLPLEGLNYSLRSDMARNWLSSRGVQVAYVQASSSEPPAVVPAPVPPRPAPTYDPPARVEPQVEQRPPPRVGIDPEDAPPTPPRASQPAAPRQQPVSPAEPREFKGPDGESMFGVPAPRFSLDAARNKVYEEAFKNAQKAFDDLDSW